MDIFRMEQELLAKGQSHNEALLGAAREFAVECAILKVEGSEVLDYVVDEGVQIYGGYGFSADYPMDRAYRDSRINRIFEGTNEINRMLLVDMILKKGLKGELDLMGPAQAVQQELMAIPDMNLEEETGLFAAEKKTIAKLKKAILMVAGTAVQKYMNSLAKEQEVLMNIADMAIKVYTAESTLLRVEKEAAAKGEEAVSTQIDIARVYLYDTVDQVSKFGKDAIGTMTEGDEQRLLAMGLKRFTKPTSTTPRRRVVALPTPDCRQRVLDLGRTPAKRKPAAALVGSGRFAFSVDFEGLLRLRRCLFAARFRRGLPNVVIGPRLVNRAELGLAIGAEGLQGLVVLVGGLDALLRGDVALADGVVLLVAGRIELPVGADQLIEVRLGEALGFQVVELLLAHAGGAFGALPELAVGHFTRAYRRRSGAPGRYRPHRRWSRAPRCRRSARVPSPPARL